MVMVLMILTVPSNPLSLSLFLHSDDHHYHDGNHNDANHSDMVMMIIISLVMAMIMMMVSRQFQI